MRRTTWEKRRRSRGEILILRPSRHCLRCAAALHCRATSAPVPNAPTVTISDMCGSTPVRMQRARRVPAGFDDLQGHVVTTLAQVGFSTRPLAKLSVQGHVRFE